MLFFEWIVNLFKIEMKEPAAFGGLHLACLLFVLILTSFLVVRYKDANDSTFRLVIGASFLVMLIFEAAKQVALTLLSGSYPWDIFPFQLCSTPLYVLPLLALLPDCRPRDIFASYTMTYALIGGVAIYLVPSTVFGTGVALNVQTMVHHGLQIVTGVYTAAYYRKRINLAFFLGGVSLFALFYSIANFLNSLFYDVLVSRGAIGAGAHFNMFNLSPRDGFRVPILSGAFDALPPSVFIVGYLFVLTAGAARLIYAEYFLANLNTSKQGE